MIVLHKYNVKYVFPNQNIVHATIQSEIEIICFEFDMRDIGYHA